MSDEKKILIIGAGFMGGGIAQVCAESGFSVTLSDISDELAKKGKSGITERWENKLRKGKINKEIFEKYCLLLDHTGDISQAASEADMIIEAASENYEIKKEVFRNLEENCKTDIIIATNTSSISITKLAGELSYPGRFIGTHFFSPVPVMKLMEIIPGLATSDDTIRKAREFGEAIGKTTILSKDSTGFVVNRLVDPMMNEAVRMLEKGVASVEDIDAGARYGLNHPLGPLELADMVGIDLLHSVMEVMYSQTYDPYFAPADLLTKMVESGFTGRKVGKGFYVYPEDGPKYVNPIFKK